MKTKTLLIILVVVSIFLLYFYICYCFVNKTIYKKTEDEVLNYVLEHFSNEYVVNYMTSQVYQDNIIYVYYQVHSDKEEYYLRFSFLKNGNQYRLLDVSKDVAHYITLLYS